MAKNVLFLIHGVGRHGDDWADGPDGPIAALEVAAGNFKFFEGRKLRDFVDFVPIRYDDLFDRILERWQDQATGIKALPIATPEALGIALGLLKKASDGKKDSVAYGADVPLYFGFRLFTQRVQLRVIQRIAETMADRNALSDGTAVKFVVLAHSLGTTVAHDSLQLLGSTDWLTEETASDRSGAAEEAAAYKAARKKLLNNRNIANPFAPGFASFKSIFMVSNTSALLQTTSAPESSIVCPIPSGNAAAAYCQKFYNVDHQFDPISKVRPFKMPKAWASAGGRNIVVDHLYNPNVHAFSHYLLHPKVHLNLLMELVDGFEPTDDEVERADNFAKFGGEVLAASGEAKKLIMAKLQKLISDAEAPAVKELARLTAALEAVDSAFAGGT